MNRAVFLKLLKPTIKGLHVMVEGIAAALKETDSDPEHDTTVEKVIKTLDSVLGQLEAVIGVLPA